MRPALVFCKGAWVHYIMGCGEQEWAWCWEKGEDAFGLAFDGLGVWCLSV